MRIKQLEFNQLINYHCRLATLVAFLDRVRSRSSGSVAAGPSLESIHPAVHRQRSHTRVCSNIITRFAAESNANIAKSRKHFVNQPLSIAYAPTEYNHLLRYSLNFPREIAVKLNGLIPLYLPRLFVPPPLPPFPPPRSSSRA